MRIIHSLEGTAWSGGQQQALFVAQQQQQAGHDVLLACQLGGELERRAGAAGLRLWPNNYAGEMNLLSIANLLRAYNSFKPDVVNVHRAWAHTQWLLISLFKRFRGLVVSRRVLFRPDFNPLSLIKYRTPVVKGFIAVSEAVAECLMATGVKREKIKVVYSATDTDRFSPDVRHEPDGPIPAATPDADGLIPPVALMIANFHRNKGHHVLVEAFRQISSEWPQLQLMIAGNKTDCEELRNMVAGTPAAEKLHLLGFRSDVPALIQRSSFTINASFQEGFPGTVRESLCMGKPVIASAIPANIEISRIVPIALFEPGNSRSLAQEILKMKKSASTAGWVHNAREAAMRFFSVPSMAARTEAAYRELTGLK
ncbi:MAG TPA: glycosyltransferase family 4 protein [Candidatus Rifleibacterium sp.]|mgnify:CR=1 FL=1|nr:glycosyltransferase family 4 protein [Candidatus Rifleibacterium sp.]HPT47549.1 glycosyltransferase family 4 protein [Candidatus Rifleibacterium sp.]